MNDSAQKTHFICQTYTEKAGKHGGLQVDKLFQYTSAAPAEERAERESRAPGCVGADAYFVVEDSESGEVSEPTFLARFGSGPQDDTF